MVDAHSVSAGLGSHALTRRDFVRSAAAAGAAAPLLALLGDAGTAAAAGGGTSVIANYAMPVDLEPGKIPAFMSWFIIQNICEGITELVRSADGKLTVRPLLADSYKQSTDGLTWTVKLKSGVKFHDGTALDSQAIVFSHDRLMNPNNPYYNPAFAQFGQPLSAMIDKIAAPDATTVEFTLKSPPNPYFLNWEAFIAAVSPTAVKKFGKNFGTNTVGTGPFRLAKFDAAGKTINLEKNPDYWASGLPKLDKLVWKAVDEAATRVAMLETQEADVAAIVPPELATRVKGNPQLALNAANVPTFNAIQFSRTVPPFDNAKLRQAVAYALDRKDLASTLYGGYWTAAINNRWQGMTGWEPYQPYAYNPDKSKALLKEAAPNGELSFTLDMPSSSSANPAGTRWGEAIQAQLAKVGIQVKLNIMESGAYWNYVNTPHADHAYYSTRQVFIGDVVNEWLMLWIHPTKGIYPDMAVPSLAPLYAQLQKTSDPKQYDNIVTQMWKIIDDEVPYIAIADGSWLTGLRTALTGVQPQGIGEYLLMTNAELK